MKTDNRYETLDYISKIPNTNEYEVFESDKKGYRITTINTSGMMIDEIRCENKANFEKYLIHEYAIMINSLGKEKIKFKSIGGELNYALLGQA